jgi:nucleotide-binding universal stress UspA family protein
MILFQPKNILSPIDLSPVSDAVLRWAGLFANKFKTRVEVLYADWWEPPRYFTQAQIQELSRQEQEGENVLRKELEAVAKAALNDLAPYNVTVVEGHPTPQILERAKKLMTTLIVMGSHGRTGMARLRLGSVAEDAVRASLCPVLIVKSVRDPGRIPAIENILCPVNFTSLSRQCLELSSELASVLGAKLWVVHATDHDEAHLEEIRGRVCGWVPQEVRGRCEVSEVVRQGNAAEQIVLMAREHAADLIVMGAQHQPFLEFTTLGTTTERVMRHSLTSVLVVPMKETESGD